MIVSYRDRRTREFAAGERVKAFSGIERQGRMKLDRLEAATALRDLGALPGNRFEALATISVITTLVPYIFFCITAWILVAERKARLVAAAGMLSTTAILFIYFVV